MSSSKATIFATVLVILNTLLLCAFTGELSIGYDEAQLFFGSGYLGVFSHAFVPFFGQSDFALRLPFILLHSLSCALMYTLSFGIVKKPSDALLSLIIFMLLPGANVAALLVNKAGVVLFLSLLMGVFYRRFGKLSYLFLPILCFVDNAFAVLFIALIFYGFHKKDNLLIAICLALFGLSMSMFGFDSGGKPKSYFLDTLLVYTAIFSPLLFVYFVFTLLKTTSKDFKPVGYYLGTSALGLSLLLSIRQKIALADFAPFVVVAAPLMVRTFFESHRTRLPQFRRFYTFGFVVVMVSLLAFTAALFFGKSLYSLYPNSAKHFAYNYHIAKELAESLKKQGYTKVVCDDEKMALRLRFYGIESGGDTKLSITRQKGYKKVSIFYTSQEVTAFYVSK